MISMPPESLRHYSFFTICESFKTSVISGLQLSNSTASSNLTYSRQLRRQGRQTHLRILSPSSGYSDPNFSTSTSKYRYSARGLDSVPLGLPSSTIPLTLCFFVLSCTVFGGRGSTTCPRNLVIFPTTPARSQASQPPRIPGMIVGGVGGARATFLPSLPQSSVFRTLILLPTTLWQHKPVGMSR